jgi:MFS family permease
MSWQWWTKSDAGLAARVAIGFAFFLTLALVDLRRNGRRATRWREYAFLVACVAAALIYGVLNDQITTTISWEYFAYGKGVAENVPAAEPANSARFRLEVAKIGMKATWTAGLVFGVALLLANNPRRDGRPRLRNRELLKYLPLILLITAAVAASLGVAGYLGAFTHFNQDFREMLRLNQWRPRRFMAVYGIHLGGYVGGVIGTAVAVLRVARSRRAERV